MAAAAASPAASTPAVTGSTGPVWDRIVTALIETFAPTHLDVMNESSSHSVPKGSETHFKVVVVSAKFEGVSILERHRLVNSCLSAELNRAGGIHALSITAKTPAQWTANSSVPKSPACLGGSKNDPKMALK